MRDGASVTLAVDGPAGPAFVVKPGCVELALRTGRRIVPVAYRGAGTVSIPGRWDRMLLALPFGRITLAFGDPIDVSTLSHEEAILAVDAALDALDPDGSRR